MSDAKIVETEETYERPRYYVSASKSSFVGEGFKTAEEAAERVRELIANGFESVNFRDNEEGEDEPWL